MKLLITAAAIVLFASTAYAGPEIVTDTNIIQMVPGGDPVTYRFAESISRISVGVEGVVSVTAQSDRLFTIQAILPGKVFIAAQAENGNVVHEMTVISAYPGIVRVSHGEDVANYHCTKTNCGYTAHVNRAEDPVRKNSKAVIVEKSAPDGTVTRTIERYGK